MTDPHALAGLLARLDAAEARLARQADHPPAGLTDADPTTGERWDAGQAWAHLAEFVPYWQGQMAGLVADGGADPIPFGRTSADAGRIGAIESGRNEAPAVQMRRLHAAVAEARAFATSLPEAAWATTGLHSRLGEMTLLRIFERFVVGHLEEHAEQLERVADAANA